MPGLDVHYTHRSARVERHLATSTCLLYNRPMSPQATIEWVRQALSGPLPGRAAQLTMATRPRPGDRPDIPAPCPHEGAVLILLYQAEGGLQFPLTVRSSTVHAHKGQISLPGGAKEPGDEGFEQTALREASEELGVATATIQLLGALSRLYIPHSRFCVHPFVGYAPEQPNWHPDPAEVAELFSAPLGDLLEPSTVHEEVSVHDGVSFLVPHYRFGTHRVWGATAMILAEFVALLRAAPQTAAS